LVAGLGVTLLNLKDSTASSTVSSRKGHNGVIALSVTTTAVHRTGSPLRNRAELAIRVAVTSSRGARVENDRAGLLLLEAVAELGLSDNLTLTSDNAIAALGAISLTESRPGTEGTVSRAGTTDALLGFNKIISGRALGTTVDAGLENVSVSGSGTKTANGGAKSEVGSSGELTVSRTEVRRSGITVLLFLERGTVGTTDVSLLSNGTGADLDTRVALSRASAPLRPVSNQAIVQAQVGLASIRLGKSRTLRTKTGGINSDSSLARAGVVGGVLSRAAFSRTGSPLSPLTNFAVSVRSLSSLKLSIGGGGNSVRIAIDELEGQGGGRNRARVKEADSLSDGVLETRGLGVTGGAGVANELLTRELGHDLSGNAILPQVIVSRDGAIGQTNVDAVGLRKIDVAVTLDRNRADSLIEHGVLLVVADIEDNTIDSRVHTSALFEIKVDSVSIVSSVRAISGTLKNGSSTFEGKVVVVTFAGDIDVAITSSVVEVLSVRLEAILGDSADNMLLSDASTRGTEVRDNLVLGTKGSTSSKVEVEVGGSNKVKESGHLDVSRRLEVVIKSCSIVGEHSLHTDTLVVARARLRDLVVETELPSGNNHTGGSGGDAKDLSVAGAGGGREDKIEETLRVTTLRVGGNDGLDGDLDLLEPHGDNVIRVGAGVGDSPGVSGA
jgi:hypothetical protein